MQKYTSAHFLPRVAFCFLPLVEYGVNPADSAALVKQAKAGPSRHHPQGHAHTGCCLHSYGCRVNASQLAALTACARHGASPDPTARVGGR